MQIKILFVALLSIVFTVSAYLAKAQQCCDVPGWQYVVEITIDNTFAGNSAQVNYPVLLPINTQTPISQNKMNASGADIRFTDSNCGPFLDYYIESGINTAATQVWVRVPSLPANAITTLFMYYGNAGAAAVSNFNAVFPSVLTVNAATTLTGVQTFDWIDIQGGGTVNLTSGATLTLNARRIIVSGTINGNSAGFGGGGGPGAGLNGGGSRGGGGGGYGGIGGSGGCGGGNSGAASGTASGPDINMGSGGGSSDCNSNAAGGGAVTLNASKIDITGTISMNGASMGGTCNEEAAGAGSGGGILISTDYLNGAGALNARGGNGQNSDDKEAGGGGGGGRIKLFVCNANNYSGTANVSKGLPGNGGQCSANDGQDGSYTTNPKACQAIGFGAESLIRVVPVAAFNAPNECLGTTANFTDASTIGAGATITNWSWDFGDASALATAQNTTHNYLSANSFSVTLTVTTNEGCTDAITQPISIYDLPVADFTFVSQCDGTAIPFTDASTATNPQTIAQWAWDLDGDLLPDNLTQNPSFTFAGPGNFTVGLGVVTNTGCTGTITKQVTVFANPTADFSTTSVCEGLATAFTDLSVGGPVSWSWDYGDASALVTTQNPNYTYATAGSYPASLTIVDGNGCTNSITNTVTVNPLPTAAFTALPACETFPVSFTDNSTVANPSTIGTWLWDFGDASPTSALQNPNHAYATANNYTVSLTATTNAGCVGTSTQPITVFLAPTVDFTFTDECENTPINFTDISTTAAPSTITAWSWDFDDGSALANTASPTHTYAADNAYNVSLTVTTSDGCLATATNLVNAYPNPVAAFTVAPACETDPSVFVNTSTINSGTITGYAWDFGGGNVDNSQNPNFVFTYAPGISNYPVTLTVTSDFGCTATVTNDALVNPLPAANFTVAPLPVCIGNPINFTGSNTSATNVPITAWDYNFNNFQGLPLPSEHAYTQDASFTYFTSLTYNVRLTVTSDQGCTSAVTNPVLISPVPTAAFTASNSCEGSPTALSDASTIVIGTVTGWDWDFGDNATSTAQNPNHQYATAGTYVVSLTTTSADGCTSSTTDTLIINPKPSPSFTSTNVCEGVLSTFLDNSTISAGTIASFSWDFGDNSPIDTLQNPNPRAYLFPDNYAVKLIVVSDSGCVDSIINPHSVFPNPISSFTYTTPASNCLPVTIRFTNTSTITDIPGQTNTPLTAQYAYGDGGIGTDDSPYTYNSAGEFIVTLISTSPNGCKDTTSLIPAQAIVVNPLPFAEFSMSNNNVTLFEPEIIFTNQSQGATLYEWDYGDGAMGSALQNPAHTYSDTGCFEILLTAENEFGCQDTAARTVCVSPFYSLYIPNTFTPNSDRYNPLFNAIGEGVKEFEIRVYNRWGEEVFRSKSLAHSWDGNLLPSGEEAMAGVYSYWVRSRDFTDKYHVYQGHITLFR